MFFINLYEIVNSIDLALEKNIKSYNNSFIDNFIDELKKSLMASNSIKTLNNIPEDTLFTLDRYEGNYAVCENRTTGKMYNIPKSLVDFRAKDGDILKFKNGKYQISYEENAKQGEIIQNLMEKTTKTK